MLIYAINRTINGFKIKMKRMIKQQASAYLKKKLWNLVLCLAFAFMLNTIHGGLMKGSVSIRETVLFT